jgi:hypothetical protein
VALNAGVGKRGTSTLIGNLSFGDWGKRIMTL